MFCRLNIVSMQKGKNIALKRVLLGIKQIKILKN